MFLGASYTVLTSSQLDFLDKESIGMMKVMGLSKRGIGTFVALQGVLIVLPGVTIGISIFTIGRSEVARVKDQHPSLHLRGVSGLLLAVGLSFIQPITQAIRYEKVTKTKKISIPASFMILGLLVVIVTTVVYFALPYSLMTFNIPYVGRCLIFLLLVMISSLIILANSSLQPFLQKILLKTVYGCL
jgi:hypothetical protein